MNPAPGMNIAISFGIAFFTTMSMTKSLIPSITMSFRFVRCSLIFSHAAPGPSVTSVTTMSKPVSRTFTAVSPITFTSFCRTFAQLMPRIEKTNLTISPSSNAFGM